MSDAVAEKAEKAPAAAGGNKKLLFIVLGVNLVLAGGLGYVMLSNKSHAAESAKAKAKAEGHEDGEEDGEAKEEGEAETAAEGEGEGKKDAKQGKFGPLIDVGTFVANLASVPSQPPRYCKVSVYAEAKNEEAKAAVEGAVVPIKAEALMMISNLKADDVIGQEKITGLSNQLLKRANKLLGKNAIKRIYFSELVVQ
jgi:flagellar basal body-associated protein FliL